MAILIDTNILLRSVQPEHPMNASAVRALAILMEREERLVVSIQNIAEFWSALLGRRSTTAWGSRLKRLGKNW
jgi:predicted nucleic acid-binding protein